MFIIINMRRVLHTGVRKFAITLVVLLSLYFLYQWLGQPIHPNDRQQAIAQLRQ